MRTKISLHRPEAGAAVSVLARLAAVVALIAIAGIQPLSASISAALDRAAVSAHDRQFDDALAQYQFILSRVPPAPLIYERLVRLSLDAGRYDDAQLYLYALADLDGWTTERRRDLAAALAQSGETARAEALSLSLLEPSSDDPLALADVYLARQAWAQAQAVLDQALAANPDDRHIRYLLGALLAPIDRARAEPHLIAALADPVWAGRAQAVLEALAASDALSRTNARTAVGLALVEQGDWALAEHALQEALAVNSVNATALGYLGFVRDQQGRDGLPDLEAALAMAPNDPTLYYLLGLHWRQTGDHQAAYAAFMDAYTLDVDNPALAAEIAASLQLMGDMGSAEEWYTEAIALAPDDLRWKSLRALFYADSGITLDDDDIQAIEEVARLAPADPDAHTSLGWAYYLTGAYDLAYDELNLAVQLDPRRPRSRYYFGVVLEVRGDRDGAADSFRFVVEQLGSESGFGLLASRGLARLGASF